MVISEFSKLDNSTGIGGAAAMKPPCPVNLEIDFQCEESKRACQCDMTSGTNHKVVVKPVRTIRRR
jgi:hypothetical protein